MANEMKNKFPMEFRLHGKSHLSPVQEDVLAKKLRKVARVAQQMEDLIVFVKECVPGRCEMEMKAIVKGVPLFARATGKTFEKSVDSVVEALVRQVRDHRDRLMGK